MGVERREPAAPIALRLDRLAPIARTASFPSFLRLFFVIPA